MRQRAPGPLRDWGRRSAQPRQGAEQAAIAVSPVYWGIFFYCAVS